jgi:hypothetical protein
MTKKQHKMQKKSESKVRKEKSNWFGKLGFTLSLACLVFAIVMLYMKGYPPLSWIIFGMALGTLGIIFCSIQIVQSSSNFWRTIFSIIGIILAIIGISIDILIMESSSSFLV